MTFKTCMDSGKFFRRPSMMAGVYVRFNGTVWETKTSTGITIVTAEVPGLSVTANDYVYEVVSVPVTREKLEQLFSEIPSVRRRSELLEQLVSKLGLS